MNDRKNLIKDNKRLKSRLEIAQHELQLIKGSKGYRTTRLLGQAKKQLKHSPLGFTKKAAKRLIKGTLLKSTSSVGQNLALIDDLQTQYNEWITFNEPDATELDHQRLVSEEFFKKPLISIITPVFNPPADILEELIESVLCQTYSNFELCLGNFGDADEIKKIIEKYSKQDSRIKNLTFNENKGIAENSNKILAEANGDYIALLDHDDTLSPDALFENVRLLNSDDYDFIYSDKDKIDEAGNRFEPFFKPGWSPEIMLNANYLTHLNIMRKSLVNEVGGWTSETDGAQDWDLFLKVVAASRKIGHIPKVLYHWRVIATSTAMSIETKPYALLGQRRAVDHFLKEVNIPAKSFHEGAELLLSWDIPRTSTLCIIRSTSNAHLRNFLSRLPNNIDSTLQFVVFHNYNLDSAILINSSVNMEYIKFEKNKYSAQLQAYIKKQTQPYLLFFDDNLSYELQEIDTTKLKGWLSIDNVLASAPRVINAEGHTIDCGGLVTIHGLRPLFLGSPPYHQAPIGNIEWVRNLKFLTPLVFMIKTKTMLQTLELLNKLPIDDETVHTATHLVLSNKGRLVFDPKISVKAITPSRIDAFEYYETVSSLLEVIDVAPDPYVNVNLSPDNPMRLTTVIQDSQGVDFGAESGTDYQQEAMVHAYTRNLSQNELAENLACIKKNNSKPLLTPRTAMFILPDFQAVYAGLNNIFSFANFLRSQNIEVTFGIMCDDKNLDRQRNLITDKYPDLGRTSKLYAVSHDNITLLPAVDIAICTQWATAYLLAIFNKSQRKCYFIQDKESSFYPRGTISALVEYSYTLGFYALANTQGLLEWYERDFGGKGVLLKSVIDLSSYELPKQPKYVTKAPFKVFFYARPNEPRNAFEIGLTGLLELKKRMGKNLEIYAAGADWDPVEYGVQDSVINMGRIAYDKLPAFYRSMDAGIMFMFSGHPGVVASELMASGCPVVVNQYDDITWNELYQHEETCLVTAPTADSVADSVYRCLTDTELRKIIIPTGRKKAVSFYGNYNDSCIRTFKVLKRPIKD